MYAAINTATAKIKVSLCYVQISKWYFNAKSGNRVNTNNQYFRQLKIKAASDRHRQVYKTTYFRIQNLSLRRNIMYLTQMPKTNSKHE